MSAPANNLITFTPGTIIQSAQVNQDLNDIVQLGGNSIGSQLQTLLSNNFSGFVQSGGVLTTASGLTVNMSAAYVVVAGITYYMPAQSFTVTASKDTYIDFVPGSVPAYQAQPVANNAAAPALYTTNAVRMGVIVSGASTITSNTQICVDNQGHLIYPLVLQTNKTTNPYKFSAYLNANMILNNTTLKILFDTKEFDTGNNFDAVTNRRFTAPVQGFYQINTQAEIGNAGLGTTEYALIFVFKNGIEYLRSTQITGSGNSTTIPRPSINKLLFLNAGDYLEIQAQTNGNRNVSNGSNVTFFSGYLVSAS